MTYADKYKDAISYIDKYWDKVTVKPQQFDKWRKRIRLARDKRFRTAWTVPNAFITPNDQKFRHIFYWDTYFIFRGLIGTRREWLLKSMVNNFTHLYKKHGVVPNFNSPASSGRSQPPFLTSMILDAYFNPGFSFKKSKSILKSLKIFNINKEWLINTAEVAKDEYFNVWDDKDSQFNHKVEKCGLNRYGDRDIGYAHSSELESGWDFTSRFYNRCDEYLPVDLNSYLFKYEEDFSRISGLLGEIEDSKAWKDRSLKRREKMNKYFWNEKEGFYFDYNYKYDKQSDFLSLAGFVPLWAGIANDKQAKRIISKLKYFETDSGLTVTAKKSLSPQIDLQQVPPEFRIAVLNDLKPKQWDYPYIWPPLEYLTVVGLLRYGFTREATRIMKNSLGAEYKIFKRHKTFFEKRISETNDLPADFHYKNQSGFGWTNAVFYRYVMILDAIESGTQLYRAPTNKPPYELAIAV